MPMDEVPCSSLSKRKPSVAEELPKKKQRVNVFSSMHKKKYQVFVSHRGPETKHSLAYHLYDMLRDRGFEVFFDCCEMDAGEAVPDQITDAISTSDIHIVIISPSFGESAWCLTELVMIIHRHRSKASRLIPVFHEVETSDVKLLTGDFKEKFYEKHLGKQSPEKIGEWKRALNDVADISGLRWGEHKGALIKMLVDRVCRYTHHGQLDTPAYVIGIEGQLTETMDEIMKPGEKTMRFVSITGIGGIGKTTFAKALFNNMHSHFERYCFVDDVKGLVQKHGIVHLQKLLVKCLLHLDIPITNSANGKCELEKRLINEEVLLVLDNIDETMRPCDIFISNYALLSPSSIVIITSRVTCVFKEMNDYNVISIEIPKLDFHKSEKLFCSQAFGASESKFQQEHKSLVRELVKKCDGIPLALVLFGKHIFELDASYWTDFLEAHKDSMPSDLRDCLQITYDSLNEGLEKRLFLDVAIFFHREKVGLLRNLWGDHPSHFELALNKLKRMLLIEVTEDCLKMHDILRDFGRAIVDKDNESNPGCRSHLWRRSDIRSVLSEGMGTNKVEGLSLLSEGSVILDEDGDGKPCPWKVDSIAKLPSLQVLFLKGRCLEGDLSKLPNGLRFLRWIEYPYDFVSFPLKSARVVDLFGGIQTSLWDLSTKEAPVKLRELGLFGCSNLQKIVWDRRFRMLKDLDLSRCGALRSVSKSLNFLERLEYVNLHGCWNLESLPETLGQLNLKTLDVSGCVNLKKLPNSLGNLIQLQNLKLDGCSSLESLPKTFGQLKNLHPTLSLCHCKNLRKLPDSFTQLRGLQVLYLDGCHSLEALPETFGELINLKQLSLSECYELNFLPKSFGELQQLQFLKLNECRLLEILPETFSQLINLRELSLFSCEKLKSLPENFGFLENLQCLRLNYCSSLKKVAMSFEKIPQMCEVIEDWGGFNMVLRWDMEPDMFPLRELTVRGLSQELLHDFFVSVSSLHKLKLQRCQSLKELRFSIDDLCNLESLFFLEGCPKLHCFSTTITPCELVSLAISQCVINKYFSQSSHQMFTNLEHLEIKDYGIMQVVDVGRLRRLRELVIKCCSVMKYILIEDNLEDMYVESSQSTLELGSKEPLYNSRKLEKISISLNNDLLSNHSSWLKELSLSSITILDANVRGLVSSKLKDEITSKSGATLQCPFFNLKAGASCGTWVATGDFGKFKCIRAALCLDFVCNGMDEPLESLESRHTEMEIEFGCNNCNVLHDTLGGTVLFAMVLYDSVEEISLDRMRVYASSEVYTGKSGWVCYFLERDEELVRHVRNSFPIVCLETSLL